jgi:2-polyprenyl-3-methyl-5-hydroxy-6-metoxy-1,4-benzoquinol methylase
MSIEITCTVCGNRDKFLPYCQQEHFTVVTCQQCQFVFIPLVYRKSLSYHDYKSKAVAEAVKEGNNWLKMQRHRLRVYHIKKFITKGSLFDLGSGWGHFLLTAQAMGFGVSGVELSEEPYKYSKDVLGLNVQRADFFELNFINCFDVITLWDVLEHIDRPKPFIEKCYKALKPGGIIVIQVPQIDSYISKKLKCRWNMMGLDHVNYFSRNTLSRLMEDSGLSVRSMRSSWEVKLFIMYTVLPLLKRFKSRSKSTLRQTDQGISAEERQHFFNRVTRLPRPVLWILVKLHNTLYHVLSFCNIGEELMLVAQKPET